MIPLVLDLDGTTVRTDTLAETVLRLLVARPITMLRRLRAVMAGRAAFKRAVAAAEPVDPACLPYDPDVLAMARAARLEGRPVCLATAADRAVAEAVASHLGVFDEVFASDGRTNLKGAAKAALLVERFGAGGFDYAGDSMADIPVWLAARRAFFVASPPRVRRAAASAGIAGEAVGAPPSTVATLHLLVRALRVHQWAKNLLVLAPVLAAHATGAGTLLRAALAFAAFSLCASSVYLFNDLVDLAHDRAHATKCRRPFASGELGLGWAPPLLAGLLAGVAAICLLLPPAFASMLALYYACTVTYSLGLKRLAIWDIVMLAGLYTLRVFAGAAATAIAISPWLLAFSLFLFFSLAVVKRLTELARAAPRTRLAGRGYAPEDADVLRSMATASGTVAVLVLALYVNGGEVLALYRRPAALWALCPILLFWISRVLLLANRGQMDDDPVVFALRDRVSLLAGAAGCLAILAATF